MTPFTGEQLNCQRETSNPRGSYAVKVIRTIDGATAGHVPQHLCSMFIWRGRFIVTGGQCYSGDLPQGGMEIPCTLHFVGKMKKWKKLEVSFPQ